jgi:hypothetical protein
MRWTTEYTDIVLFSLKVGWLVPIAVLFVISFPPVIGTPLLVYITVSQSKSYSQAFWS